MSFDFRAGANPAFAATGAALMAHFFQFLQQQEAQSGQTVNLPPLPAGEALASLQQQFLDQQSALWQHMLSGSQLPESLQAVVNVKDRRFSSPEWREIPHFDYLRQSYLINADFLRRLVDLVPAENAKVRGRLDFLTRQYIDALSPANFAATNPDFVRTAMETRGESITRGLQNLLGDMRKGRISMTDESAFEVGRDLALTEGSVVHENELMQLIQYAPTTPKVAKRPLVIVPPCINKFYILDLQPGNSLVRFAVDQGHTVFLVSWRNPGSAQGAATWDDYLEQGPMRAIAVARDITRARQINALGFCVGGTILTSALAVLRARGEDPVASLTLLTTLLDFADTGEIGLFVDEQGVATREATIGKGGLLLGRELASVFSGLRANDLIWPYITNNYLKGKAPEAFDLLYWNSDSTNLPGPFYCWYLRNMYLENALRIPGKLEMCGQRVDLAKVDMPNYLLATREDHIVPWQSAYQSVRLLGGETTFVLGASGHIAGVVNPASRNKRSYWSGGAVQHGAEQWLEGSEETPGSWWTHWASWLAEHTGGERAAPGKCGNSRHAPIEPAPGRYVKTRAEDA